jgi:hypothetical protein
MEMPPITVTPSEAATSPALDTGIADTPPRPRRPAWLVGWAVLVGGYAMEALAIVRADRAWLIHRLPDDAFYYLGIGQHIARGQGATSDGLHHTNGFHPLWQLIVAAWATVCSGDVLVRVVLLTELAASLGAIVVLYRLLSPVWGPGVTLFALVAAMHSTFAIVAVANGMESGLVVLTLSVVIATLAAFLKGPTTGRAAVCGAACGLAVLSRVDLAAVIWVVPVVMAWRTRLAQAILVWAGGAGGVVAPWVVWSQLWAGHVLPVSGALKLHELTAQINARFGGRLSWGYMHWLSQLAYQYGRGLETNVADSVIGGRPGLAGGLAAHLLSILAVSGALLVAFEWYRSRRQVRHSGPLSPAAVALLAGAAMVTAKAFLDLVTVPYWASAWYSAPSRLASGVVIGAAAAVAVRRSWNWRPIGGAALAVIAVLLVVPLTERHLQVSSHEAIQPAGWQDANLEAAAWIRTAGPAARYGSTDSGLLAYYLDPRPAVVNLDGLVNSYSYSAELLHNAPPLARYQSEGVEMLIGRLPVDSSLVPTCATLAWTSSHGILYGGGPDQPGWTSVPLRIYDLRPCGRGSGPLAK